MPYREVSMIEIKEALRLWRRGEFKKAIARKLGIARNTVRAYIKAATKCGLSRKGGEPSDEEITAVLVALKAAPRAPARRLVGAVRRAAHVHRAEAGAGRAADKGGSAAGAAGYPRARTRRCIASPSQSSTSGRRRRRCRWPTAPPARKFSWTPAG